MTAKKRKSTQKLSPEELQRIEDEIDIKAARRNLKKGGKPIPLAECKKRLGLK